MAVLTDRSAGDTTIRPFTIEIPEAELEDLRARIAATRFPEKETVEDDSQGVPLALMQDLARYWATDYDWRKCEARLNAVPNFITEIDGLDIHFIHVRSKHEDALPLVVCHGWPGSIVEQLKLIGRLTDPTAHGASASDAFHVVIPSMPGYGFSGKPTSAGWDPVRIGKAYVELMKRLGYARFVAQGGDWGAVVVDAMAGGRADPAAAEPAPPELVGIHTNMAGVIPPDLFVASFIGSPAPSGLSDEELSTYEQAAHVLCDARGSTGCSWGRVRRRSTDWLTHRSISRRSCSTTATGAVSPAWFSRSSRDVCRSRATSRVTTSWTTSRSSG